EVRERKVILKQTLPLPSPIIHHPSSITHHPSSIIHHPSSITHHPTTLNTTFPVFCPVST
ncbi:hypothetical protein, partial [Petrimonas sp.]|uniref:hypothetical protein n=1 Tax=Petrimonas sp. TaxID=2023866 RepID=UPI003F513E5D